MKKGILVLFLFAFLACSKKDAVPAAPIVPVVVEEPVKFTTSPDIAASNFLLTKDTLEFTINVSSKMPASGFIYSIAINRVDTALGIFKLDSTISQTSLVVKSGGFSVKANYTIKITISSKSTSSNSVNQSFQVSRGRIYKNYLKTSYELSNFDTWFSSAQLYKADGSKYNNNPFIDEQSTQIDIDGDGLEDLFYYEGYDLNINPTPNPPPSVFMNTGTNLKQTPWTGPAIKLPHGTKLLVGDFNNDSLPDIFSLVAIDPPNSSPAGFLNTFDFCNILLNSSTGFNKVKDYTDQGFWYSGCSGDIDNDGDLDIIAFNFHNQSNGVKSRIMWNDGKANFTLDFNGVGDIPVVYQSELADINNDGFLDLVIVFVPSSPSGRVNDFRVLWGNGKGFSLTNSTAINIAGTWNIVNLDFTDVDADGTKEIMASGNYDNPSGTGAPIYFISLFKSADKGKTYSDKTSQYIDNNTAGRFYHIRVQDIDKNGLLDIFSGEKRDNFRWEWNGTKFIKK
jgi:hypothetical protein